MLDILSSQGAQAGLPQLRDDAVPVPRLQGSRERAQQPVKDDRHCWTPVRLHGCARCTLIHAIEEPQAHLRVVAEVTAVSSAEARIIDGQEAQHHELSELW